VSSLSIFAGEYDGATIRVTEDGRFSVFDVLVAFVRPTERKGKVGKAINPRQVLKSITSKNPEVVQKMDSFKFPGRGQQETPVANEEGIYQILMLCPGERGAEFRQFAATILRERREEESDGELAYNRGRQRAIKVWKHQGKSDKEIAARIKGIEARNHFTETLQAHGIEQGWEYAGITNALYLELLGDTAKGLKQSMGLSHKANLRDNFDMVKTMSVGLAEALATEDVESNDLQGFDPCKGATERAARKVKRALED
jgi:hypothetical protein